MLMTTKTILCIWAITFITTIFAIHILQVNHYIDVMTLDKAIGRAVWNGFWAYLICAVLDIGYLIYDGPIKEIIRQMREG